MQILPVGFFNRGQSPTFSSKKESLKIDYPSTFKAIDEQINVLSANPANQVVVANLHRLRNSLSLDRASKDLTDSTEVLHAKNELTRKAIKEFVPPAKCDYGDKYEESEELSVVEIAYDDLGEASSDLTKSLQRFRKASKEIYPDGHLPEKEQKLLVEAIDELCTAGRLVEDSAEIIDKYSSDDDE